jgi:comEA protein
MKKVNLKLLSFSLVLMFLFIGLFSFQVKGEKKAIVDKININTASLVELQKLPRVGEIVAQRIIDFRKEHGPFNKIEEIMKVPGIGEKIFAELKDLITIGSNGKSE